MKYDYFTNPKLFHHYRRVCAVSNTKFQFLIKGQQFSHENKGFNWHKKFYCVEEFTNKSLEQLCGLSALGELIAIRQYTGLKDRNGVEIYEGDIVEYWFIHIHRTNAYEMHGVEPEMSWPINEIYADKRVGAVYFDRCGFFVNELQIAFISDEFSSLILDLHYCGDLDYGLKEFVVLANEAGLKSPIRKNCAPFVIGNIHQNHELLESQK